MDINTLNNHNDENDNDIFLDIYENQKSKSKNNRKIKKHQKPWFADDKYVFDIGIFQTSKTKKQDVLAFLKSDYPKLHSLYISEYHHLTSKASRKFCDMYIDISPNVSSLFKNGPPFFRAQKIDELKKHYIEKSQDFYFQSLANEINTLIIIGINVKCGLYEPPIAIKKVYFPNNVFDEEDKKKIKNNDMKSVTIDDSKQNNFYLIFLKKNNAYQRFVGLSEPYYLREIRQHLTYFRNEKRYQRRNKKLLSKRLLNYELNHDMFQLL